MARKNYYRYNSEKPKKVPFKQVLLLLGALIVALFIYFNFFKAEPTIVAGFNWTNSKITVETDDKVVEVEPNNMYSITIQRKGDLIVTLNDENGEAIRENRFLIGHTKSIILELVSSTQNQCLVEADVSTLYYDLGGEARVSEFTLLNEGKPTNSFVYETDADMKFYVYPGRYSKDLLPELLPKDQKVLGVFFVDCENIENVDNLNSDILGSIFYEVK